MTERNEIRELADAELTAVVGGAMSRCTSGVPE